MDLETRPMNIAHSLEYGSFELSPWQHPDYEIIEELGRGGMGIVYKAIHRQLRTELAIKVLQPHVVDQEGLIRFQREAQILSQLQHPNLVRVSHFGQHMNCPFYVMDYLRGRDLKEAVDESFRLTGGSPELETLREQFLTIAKALQYCHQRGVLHRDIKPHNIFLEADSGRPILVDFGLAKRSVQGQTDSFERSLSQSGVVLGTAAYMSPELLNPSMGYAASPAADVWALGVTMFYGLTGRLPYAGQSLVDIYMKITSEDCPRLQILRPDLPDWLDNLCAHMLRRQPEERASVEQVIESLTARTSSASYLSVQDPIEDRDAEAAPASTQSFAQSLLWILVGAMLTATVGLLLSQLRRPQNDTVFLNALPSVTSATQIEVTGALKYGPARLKLGSLAVLANKSGAFRASLNLKPGANKVPVLLEDGRKVAEISILKDSEPPQLKLPLFSKDQLAWPEDDLLKGQVIDVSPCTLSIQGQEVKVGADGHFQWPLPKSFKSGQSLTLVAIDAGRQVSTQSLVVTRQSSPVYDLQRWNRASEVEQDQAILGVTAALPGKQYEFVETRVFRCAEQSHRIAIYRHIPTNMEMSLIPGGDYEIGIDDPEAEHQHFKQQGRADLAFFNCASPKLRVKLRPFLIGRFELTEKQWSLLTKDPSSMQRAPPYPKAGLNRDMIKDALKAWGAARLRLPTEAEWEAAARAGSQTRYYWGPKLDTDYLWYSGNAHRGPHLGREHQNKANAFGLVDVLGNMWEICEDDFFPNYAGHPGDHRPRFQWNPGRTGRMVVRGGGFPNPPVSCSLSVRIAWQSHLKGGSQGARLVRSVPLH